MISLRRVLLLVCAVSALFAMVAPPASARRKVPDGFVGVMLDGPWFESGFPRDREMPTVLTSGVESVRFELPWRDAQPYRSFAEVPAGQRSQFKSVKGVPTTFGAFDASVLRAALRGLHILPVVGKAPQWARKYPNFIPSPPANNKDYARFIKALVQRYGPKGTFWRRHRRQRRFAIRSWQVWNEPNNPNQWKEPGFTAQTTQSVPGYVALLRAARPAIKSADRKAHVVHAGVFGRSWEYLRAVYRAGGRGLFDDAAIHPFVGTPERVIEIIRLVREEMSKAGDGRTGLYVTEWSFPSATGHLQQYGGFERTEQGQAVETKRTLNLFALYRRLFKIRAVFHYTWITREVEGNRFTYAGLRAWRSRRVSKPALKAFKRTALSLEGCRRKSRRSTRCARRR